MDKERETIMEMHEVWYCDDDDDVDSDFWDKEMIEAGSPEEAAEKWAELEDMRGDFDIAGGGSVDVYVCTNGTIRRFRVTGEYSVHYYVRPVGDEDE